jgi:hypothetical protein
MYPDTVIANHDNSTPKRETVKPWIATMSLALYTPSFALPSLRPLSLAIEIVFIPFM